MSPKLLLPLLPLLLLISCSGAAPKVPPLTRIPIAPWPADDQVAAGRLIEDRCGKPPVCPRDAYLENATLSYVQLRAEAEAANKRNK